jgi:anti-sigma28 factor (negative regulator of flagellin synthesis)
MTSTLQTSPQAQLQEVPTSRFARQPMTIAWPDPEPAPVRSARVAQMQARVQYRDYQIDSAVLAEAIIDHVCLR